MAPPAGAGSADRTFTDHHSEWRKAHDRKKFGKTTTSLVRQEHDHDAEGRAPPGVMGSEMVVSRGLWREAVVVIAAGGLFAFGAAPASAADHREVQQTVTVVGNGSSVQLSSHTIQAGSIRFNVSTTNPPGPDGGGSDVSLFQPKPGKTLNNIFADLQEAFGETTGAKGTRDLTRDATFLGLAGVNKGYPEVATTYLQPGTYYLMDLANPPKGGPPTVSTLTVGSNRTSFEQDSDLHSQVSVQATSGHARKFVGGSGPGGGVGEVEAAGGVEGVFGGATH